MNPQEQPTNPTPAVTPNESTSSSPESDAAALQAIDVIEADQTTSPNVTQPESLASTEIPTGAPVETPASFEPTETPGAVPEPSVMGGQTDTSPVEASAAGVAAGLGVQAATNGTLTPSAAPAPVVGEKKKTNKLVVVLLVVVLVAAGAAAGYFVWQSM